MRTVAVAIVVVAAFAHVAHAYPQFQLSKDQTCSGCHLSPSGGGLLNENGFAVAQAMATFDVKPEAAHGALVGPHWLELSADLRAAGGIVENRGTNGAAFPMQADFQAAVFAPAGFTFVASVGVQDGHDIASFFASREHYAMWQSHPGSPEGLFVRAGRFMPVFGLRFVEHTAYTRRYGQTPLYGEAYGAAVAYVSSSWEAHVTGFLHDPFQYSAEQGNGAAAYTEARITKTAQIGLEGRFAKGDLDQRLAGGVTGKLWLDPVLLQAEVIGIHQSFAAGGERDQITSYLLGTWFFYQGWMLDVGIGQFDEDLAVPHVSLEGIDVNVHWFATSHLELLLTNRIQTISFTSGGPTSGYALVQVHYRL